MKKLILFVVLLLNLSLTSQAQKKDHCTQRYVIFPDNKTYMDTSKLANWIVANQKKFKTNPKKCKDCFILVIIENIETNTIDSLQKFNYKNRRCQKLLFPKTK